LVLGGITARFIIQWRYGRRTCRERA